MELMEDRRPIMARFTAAVDARIVSKDGSMCAIFEAGQTQNIRRELFDSAIAAGLMPEDEIAPAPPPEPKKLTQDEIVHTGLIEACKALIARGNPGDFTIVGQPRAASVKKLVDFDFNTKDVERAFSEAMHEVEQDGDDSTEHSEQSSSVTE